MNKIIERINNVTQKNPTQLAYKNGSETKTYQDLSDYSNKVANFLDSELPDNNQPIIVFGGQQFEMLAIFLGAIKSGHAYIPVDESSDPSRIQQINNVAKPALILNWSDLTEFDVETPVIDKKKLNDIFSSDDSTYTEDHSVADDENFYIIFTSGTTGTPKGVQISTLNLIDFVDWVNQEFQYHEDDNVMLQAPFSFDLSVFSIYPALTNGATLEILDKSVTGNFAKLQESLKNSEFNVWVSTPSFFELCCLFPDFKGESMPNLQKFIFCGEELTHAAAKKVLNKFPNAKLYNTYGPTENTVAITSIEITPEVLENYDRLPIGYLKDNMDYKIQDSQSDDNGLEVGELLVNGPDVSKGYINNPVQTEKAFENISGETFYHTGDMIARDSDGLLFYRGRTDFQVKMHGYRIELEEIDALLGNLVEVKQSSTVPLYDSDHKVKKLIAYVVLESDMQEQDAEELSLKLKEDLKKTTMDYMIPNVFRFVDSLPITSNGKIDRKALIGTVNA
ncbi:D-alanine--poly(phosphoribitol) ligase subunit DltA [Companilactobacillus metriopterae]|uniref:D-alanine--poly(phosphoribitol) ligase subunit DltA n=1 Tax=Companilactobacillus metriopterae TaxID=1909267 RepID=UPI00100BF639|nr:D-alanine--poly(phosphoribitol) ligase subunit DltA [Companilactobacillus metriopterae]